eukprot:m.249365 g.249365  ORF g.249365 m.249365 type:complete len:59 (+) comp15878_c0_seq3:2580-2756(+)
MPFPDDGKRSGWKKLSAGLGKLLTSTQATRQYDQLTNPAPDSDAIRVSTNRVVCQSAA